MKILIVGSESVHVSSFIESMYGLEDDLHFLSETPCYQNMVRSSHIVSFRNLNPVAILKSYSQLKRALKEVNPDVVHIHQINRLAYFTTRACSKLSIPCISTAWGSDVLLIPKQNRFFRVLTKMSLQRSRFVTADSNDMIDKMQALAAHEGDKYVLLQYGIDPIPFSQKEEIVYSNRMHKELYRIDKIIEYFAQFHLHNPSWTLVIAGSGPDTEDLKEQAARIGLGEKIRFVGFTSREENRNWYARSRFYISIPVSDGTAVSLLEAMSAGCVPIVPDLDVSREWIEDGVNGVILNEQSNPIERALEVHGERCAEINDLIIRKRASREKSNARFLQLYTLAINDRLS